VAARTRAQAAELEQKRRDGSLSESEKATLGNLESQLAIFEEVLQPGAAEAGSRQRRQSIMMEAQAAREQMATVQKRVRATKGSPSAALAVPPPEPPFDPYKGSIWVPRIAFADGKDLYDTNETLRERFFHDWKRALNIGVISLIMRYDDDATADVDGDGIPDEVEDVCAAFWDHRLMMGNLWSYYAAVSGTLSMVTLNAFTQFTEDASLVGRVLKRRYFDTLFIEVNNMAVRTGAKVIAREKARRRKSREEAEAEKLRREEARHKSIEMYAPTRPMKENGADAETAALNAIAYKVAQDGTADELVDRNDSKVGLSRVEFYVAFVHMAIERYIRSGELHDVSESLSRLLNVEISARMGKSLPVADDFRRLHCYVRETNNALKVHEASLRIIFDALAFSTASKVKKLLNLDTWLGFLRALNIIHLDLSDRKAILAFAWSRPVVHDGFSVAGGLKENNLPFEGFLEAICRVSTLKALPTTAEVSASGEADAGTFMLALEHGDSANFHAFLEDSKTHVEWGEEPRGEPVDVRVTYLLQMMFRKIDKHAHDHAGASDAVLQVTQTAMSSWVRHNLKKGTGGKK